MTTKYFYDFTLTHGFNDTCTEINCRMKYRIIPGCDQTLTQPAEAAELDVIWVRELSRRGGPGVPIVPMKLSKIADVLYDLHADDIIADAMEDHQDDEPDEDDRDRRRDDLAELVMFGKRQGEVVL